MPEEKKLTGWWHTMPGVLTAIAGILTAAGGLALALHQVGLLGKPTERDTSAQLGNTKQPGAPSDAPLTASQASSPQPSSQNKPWSKIEARITGQDDTMTIVRADTLSNCISVNPTLTLANGQDVPFERMKSFEVLRADPAGPPGAKAELVITLVDGKVIKDEVAANCDVFGYNDVGRFTTYFQKMKRVDFLR